MFGGLEDVPFHIPLWVVFGPVRIHPGLNFSKLVESDHLVGDSDRPYSIVHTLVGLQGFSQSVQGLRKCKLRKFSVGFNDWLGEDFEIIVFREHPWLIFLVLFLLLGVLDFLGVVGLHEGIGVCFSPFPDLELLLNCVSRVDSDDVSLAQDSVVAVLVDLL